MRKSFVLGDNYNCFNIISLAFRKHYKTQVVLYWNCKCLICGRICQKSTSDIKKAKSCGCQQFRKGVPRPELRKPRLPKDIDPRVNVILGIYKKNAISRGLDFNLSYKDVENFIFAECYYCGDKKSNVLKKKGYSALRYNGIDRIDNNKGYSRDNCVSCCNFCNKAKRNQELKVFLSKAIKIAKIHTCVEKDDEYFELAKKRIKNREDEINGVGTLFEGIA